jgi:predicted  nucleic acid-binding Zn-ribbon protein
MLEALEKLLILQDRDRRLLRLRAEVADIEPQRRLVQNRRAAAEESFEKARLTTLRLESERKKLELDADAKKELITKYSAQQWQTRKNEEYKALTHEIEMCKEAIRELEDQQLSLMEQLEAAEAAAKTAAEDLEKARGDCDLQLRQLADTEVRLTKQLKDAEAARAEAAAAIDAQLLSRYERILKSKGGNIVVGIERGVCGGCHMKLSRQDVINTQANREIVNCPNCGRILYYTRDMDVRPSE